MVDLKKPLHVQMQEKMNVTRGNQFGFMSKTYRIDFIEIN